MAKINDTTTYPSTTPATGDLLIGTDVSNTTNDANGETVNFDVDGLKTYVNTVTATSYSTTGGSTINVDISGCNNFILVISDISLSVTDKPQMYFSTDGGSTTETTAFQRFLFDSTTETYANNVAYEFLGPASNTGGSYYGVIKIYGHEQSDATYIETFSASSSEAMLRGAIVPTTSSYDTLQIQAPSGTFDVVDMVGYKIP